jgi:hypothetical protein
MWRSVRLVRNRRFSKIICPPDLTIQAATRNSQRRPHWLMAVQDESPRRRDGHQDRAKTSYGEFEKNPKFEPHCKVA